MKKIVAFGASSSNNSINKKLAKFASEQLKNTEVIFLDLNDYKMPLYDIDDENANGIPALALEMKKHITETDGILISFAEHNGSYSTVFKNILDWISRIKGDTFLNKPMFLLATSPGKRGGSSVLSHASSRFPFMGGNVVATYALPSFNDNFTVENGITDATLLMEFKEQLKLFQATIDGAVEG
jgi:chromate reductase